MENNWWEVCRGSIMDDTSECQQPEFGTFWRSFADTVEIIAVSPPMERRGKVDRAVRFRVVEVHSPEDSGMQFTDERILWGDMVDAYERVDWTPPTNTPTKTEDLIPFLVG